jgi:hypothetical protein
VKAAERVISLSAHHREKVGKGKDAGKGEGGFWLDESPMNYCHRADVAVYFIPFR